MPAVAQIRAPNLARCVQTRPWTGRSRENRWNASRIANRIWIHLCAQHAKGKTNDGLQWLNLCGKIHTHRACLFSARAYKQSTIGTPFLHFLFANGKRYSCDILERITCEQDNAEGDPYCVHLVSTWDVSLSLGESRRAVTRELRQWSCTTVRFRRERVFLARPQRLAIANPRSQWSVE